jgi:hypothetical protein
LDAIVYYAQNSEIFCSVANELVRDVVSSISILQEVFNDSNVLKVLETNLIYFHANFCSLAQPTTELEATTNLLSETIK